MPGNAWLVSLALGWLLVAAGAPACDVRLAVGGQDDGEAARDLLAPFNHPDTIAFFAGKTERDRVRLFREAEVEWQLAILDALSLYRLESRGTMRELHAIQWLGLCVNAPPRPRLGALSLAAAVRHLLAVFAPTRALVIGSIEVQDERRHGMSQLNSNAGWNRGEAVSVLATLLERHDLPENTQAAVVRAIVSRVLGRPENMGHDAMERRMALESLGKLSRAARLPERERGLARQALHDVVEEQGRGTELGALAQSFLDEE